jgi:hypothetical protein
MNSPAFTSASYAEQLPAFNPVRNRWEMFGAVCQITPYLFETEAAALEFKRLELRQLIDREERARRIEAEQRKAAEERAAYLASFRGFLPSDRMRAGRILQTLEKKYIHRGEVRTRKQIVETLVNEGRVLTANGLECASGYAVIGKTERAYAEHLIALRDAAQPASVSTP